MLYPKFLRSDLKMSALDLDLLSDYLDGDQNEHGLDFAATHGFLCAIAVGPQPVSPKLPMPSSVPY